MVAPQPTMFVTGPDSTLEVSDVYSSNDISALLIATRHLHRMGFYRKSNLPSNNIADVAGDDAITDGGKRRCVCSRNSTNCKGCYTKGKFL